jgi:hypothetical protein
MTDEEYRQEYPDASDTDIEILRWSLHDESDESMNPPESIHNLPWRAEPATAAGEMLIYCTPPPGDSDIVTVVRGDAAGRVTAEVEAANAATIVKAVNGYQRLVNALNNIIDYFGEDVGPTGKELFDGARAVIAEGETLG